VTAALALGAAFLASRRASWRPAACSAPGARRQQAASHQGAHLLPGILQVPMLVARALAHHDQAALGVLPRSREGDEAGSCGGIEAQDAIQVDPKLHLRGHLVDVLAAGSRRAHGLHRERRLGDHHALRHPQRLGHA
jgi:hypothetical protein